MATNATIRSVLGSVAIASLCALPVLAQQARGEDEKVRQEASGGNRAPRGENKASEGQGKGMPKQGARTDSRAAERSQAQPSEEPRQGAERLRGRTVALLALSDSQIKQLQRALRAEGFYSGPIDGLAGRQTRSALTRYYRAQAELARSGHLLAAATGAFGFELSEIERVSGRREPERQTTAGRVRRRSTSPSATRRSSDEMLPATDRSRRGAGQADDGWEYGPGAPIERDPDWKPGE